MTLDCGSQLVEPSAQLEVDVDTDVRRLVDEERERLVEGGKLRRESTQLLEREVPHAACRRAVADLVEVIRVRDHERASRQVEHVELDQVDAVLDGGAERPQRVLRRERCRASMADPEGPSGRRWRSITRSSSSSSAGRVHETGALQPEELLDLVPEHDAEGDARDDQQDQRRARTGSRRAASVACAPPGTGGEPDAAGTRRERPRGRPRVARRVIASGACRAIERSVEA